MEKIYVNSLIENSNKAEKLMGILQPLVAQQLKHAKRTTTGMLFARDVAIIKQEINSIAKIHGHDERFLSFYYSENDKAFVLSISFHYQRGPDAYSPRNVVYRWYKSDSNYEFKYSPNIIESIEHLKEAIDKHRELSLKIDEIQAQRSKLQRIFGLDNYGKFVGFN